MAFVILGFGICYKHTTPPALISNFGIGCKHCAPPAFCVVCLTLRSAVVGRLRGFLYERLGPGKRWFDFSILFVILGRLGISLSTTLHAQKLSGSHQESSRFQKDFVA